MTVPRRSFLARLGAAAAAFTTLEAPALGAQAPQGPVQRAVLRHPQDAWLDAIPGAHRLIVDGPTSQAGADGARFIWNFLRTSGPPYGLKDSDHAVVLTLRHGGTAFAFPQSLWDKYPTLADEMEVKHPITHQKVTKSLLRPGLVAPDALGEALTLDGLAKRGVHFAICGAATSRFSGEIAAKVGKPTEAKAIYEELVASLPANAHVVTSGMVGVQRAQEYGYAYVHAG